MRGGLVHMRVEQAAAQRHVVQPGRKVGFDQRRNFIEVEQTQVGVGLALVLGPGGTHHFRCLRRALRDIEHVAMGVAHRRLRDQGINDRLLLREQRALKTHRIDEHQRHVLLGLHRQRLAVGDVDDQVVA